jgi:hypothetical protein
MHRLVGQRNDALLWKIMGDIQKSSAAKDEVPCVSRAECEAGSGKQKAFGISLAGERTNATLRAVELSCPNIEWFLGHSLNEGTLKKIIASGSTIVLISSLPTNPLEVIEAFSRRLRSVGYTGWIVVGNYRLKSFDSVVRKRLKDAGIDYSSHRLHAICRIINYTNESMNESPPNPVELKVGHSDLQLVASE